MTGVWGGGASPQPFLQDDYLTYGVSVSEPVKTLIYLVQRERVRQQTVHR